MKRFISWIERTAAAFFARVEASCENDTRSLACFRVLWGLYLLLFATPYVSWVGQVPPGFFSPPPLSLAALFDTFPSWPTLVTIEIGVLTAILAITLGFHTRLATGVFVASHTFLYSFQYSFGKIDHEILLVAVTACLAFTNWGSQVALRPDRRLSPAVTRRALAVAGIFIAFGMFTAGQEKLVQWIDFDPRTSGFLSWFYNGYMNLGRTYLAAPLVTRVPPTWFEALDYAAVAFELSAGVAVVAGARGWRGWLWIACLFHLGNTLLLNIPFLVHVPVYLAFVRWPASWSDSLASWFAGPRSRWTLVALVPVALYLAHVGLRLTGSGSRFLFIDDRTVELPARLYAGLLLWWFALVALSHDLWTRRRVRQVRGTASNAALDPARTGVA